MIGKPKPSQAHGSLEEIKTSKKVLQVFLDTKKSRQAPSEISKDLF